MNFIRKRVRWWWLKLRPILLPGRVRKGKIIKILGEAYAPFLDTSMIMEEFKLPGEFLSATLEEAGFLPSEVNEKMAAGRKDLRKTLTLTIDGEHAKDFDDAVSAEYLPNNQIRLVGQIGRTKTYQRALISSMTVVSHDGPLRMARDGETFDGSSSFAVEKSPTRLTVFVPPASG